MTGWIKLHRSLKEWEWYDDINVKVTFIHILLSANHKEGSWRGHKIDRGQMWTSISHLSEEIGITEKQIRNALKKLEKTNEILTKGASKGTMITVCKYDSYQDEENQMGEQGASKGRAKGEQGATNKNKENNKEGKEKKPKGIYDDVYFENKEVNDLFVEHLKIRTKIKAVNSDKAVKALISKLRIIAPDKDDAIAVINNSIVNSWKSYFPLKN